MSKQTRATQATTDDKKPTRGGQGNCNDELSQKEMEKASGGVGWSFGRKTGA